MADRAERTPAVVARRVSKRYGRVLAVRDLSVEVCPDTILGLIGPNGAGKTTLLAMLAGFVRPTSGNLSVLGETAGSTKLAGRIGILFQDAALPAEDTPERFLIYLARLQGLLDPKKSAQSALQRVDALVHASTRCSSLSHGLRKRVALAAALLGQPELLILDEPASGLDPSAASELWGILRRLSGEATVIVSSHDLTEVELTCDTIAFLDQGRMTKCESVNDIASGPTELCIRFDSADLSEQMFRSIEGVDDVTMSRDDRCVRLQLSIDVSSTDEIVDRVMLELRERDARIRSLTIGRSLGRWIDDTNRGGA